MLISISLLILTKSTHSIAKTAYLLRSKDRLLEQELYLNQNASCGKITAEGLVWSCNTVNNKKLISIDEN